jgi:hypothetical protein
VAAAVVLGFWRQRQLDQLLFLVAAAARVSIGSDDI